MIKNILHIVLIIIMSFCSVELFSQFTIDNSGGGKINNKGTIRVKNGQVNGLPDTLGGRVEFSQDDASTQQAIPNIVYNQLVLKNKAKKILLDTYKNGSIVRNLVVRDSLIVSDSANFTSRWIGLFPEDVFAKGTVKNSANYNGPKFVVLNSDTAEQNMLGDGSYSKVRIDNKKGVNVVEGGGFKITETLELKSGELRNDNTNNFVMQDSTEIIRYTGSSLASEPKFDGRVDVQYVGNGSMVTGGEIPSSKQNLQKLKVENTNGIVLSKNATANDSIIVGSNIITGSDTLTLSSMNNPKFQGDPSVEIMGNFRRTNLTPGDTFILNNPYTWVVFKGIGSLGTMTSIVSTILPKNFSPFDYQKEKVERGITLVGYDIAGNTITEGVLLDFGFGWRKSPLSSIDEMNGQDLMEVKLLRWIGADWYDYESELPKEDVVKQWASSFMSNLGHLGSFAIGSKGFVPLVFRGRVFLEGAFIENAEGKMRTDLQKRGLLSETDLNKYPLNLDKNLTEVIKTSIPDSVVDFIVLEFRKNRTGAADFIKTGFVKYDGSIIDEFGNTAINLKKKDGIDSAGGNYFVAIRHRNHSSVVTESPIEIIPANNNKFYDFSESSLVEGGTTALKLVDVTEDGRRIFAMRGGYLVEGDPYVQNQLGLLNTVTQDYDWKGAWKKFTVMGYENADYDLSGIVTTRDFNISWNNRQVK